MAQLSLKHIHKIYENRVHVVKDFCLDIADKEFIVFVGPSGCGKSTTLRMIAGLEEISAGDLTIGDVVMNDVPAKARDIAMVFQNYALYPHMTVYDNMAFGLKMQKIAPNVIEERVSWAAQILGLRDYLKRKPGALSGGSASVWHWVAPSCGKRVYFLWMSRCQTLMRSYVCRCGQKSANFIRN